MTDYLTPAQHHAMIEALQRGDAPTYGPHTLTCEIERTGARLAVVSSVTWSCDCGWTITETPYGAYFSPDGTIHWGRSVG